MPTLGWFIERNFIDVQQYTFKKSLRTTYLALIVTIIFSSISLYLTLVSSKSSTEFWKENEHREAISQSYVNNLLEKIVEYNEEQTEMVEKLNKLIEQSNDKDLSDFKIPLITYLNKNEAQNNEMLKIIKEVRKIIVNQ